MTGTLDVAAARARFSALRSDFAFLDAPGGSQVPDEVGEAIATTLREASANLGAGYATSQRVGAIFEEAGSPPTDLQTTARVRLEQQEEGGFRITRIAISTVGDVPGFDAHRFAELAEQAKATCPVSLALAGTAITLEARLQ